MMGFVAIANPAYSFIVDTGEPVAVGTKAGTAHAGVPEYLFDFSQGFAAQFTLSQGYKISSIEGFLGVSDDSFQPSTYNISVYGDGNDVPDTTTKLFSQERTRIFTAAEGYHWDGLSGLDLDLGPGTYWLAYDAKAFAGFMPGQAPHPNTNEATIFHTGGPSDGVYFSSDGLGLGFRVDGSAIGQGTTVTPEPASMFLLGGGLMTAFYQRRNKSSAKK